MKFYGDIELINGKILGLHVENVESISLSEIDSNRLLSFNGKLYFNNGTGYKLIQFSDTDQESPLITTLGPWINDDLSFNSTLFNEFNNVSGLTSENSLFDVLNQLDTAISNVTQNSISDLQDVMLNSPDFGDILIFTSNTFVNISLENAIKNYGNLRIASSMQDYETSGVLLNNDLLYWNSNTNKFSNKRCFYRFSSQTSQSEYVLTHNLGVKYCFVEIFDKLTSKKISSNNYEVKYVNENQVEIILNNQTAAEIIVFSLS
jgi:hypothetical protein